MPTPLRVIVTQGHRNTSGGNPAEQARTPAIANAVTAALVAAGHAATCLQNADGTADDWFAGSLDAVARAVMRDHQARPVDLLLDIHFEGNAANTSGVFAIVPDGDGLRTLTHYAGTDRAVPGSRAYNLARAIAHEVARCTGLPLRRHGVLEPGVMSERQTRVGGDLGWRLAMFGYTAPARDRMARVVLECGNLVADAAIIGRPDFGRRVAEGVVAAISALSAGEEPAYPPHGVRGDLVTPRMVTVTVPALQLRSYAGTDQPVRARLTAGSALTVSGWMIGEAVAGNPVWWLAGEAGATRWRMWSGGTDLAGAAVLALPTRPASS